MQHRDTKSILCIQFFYEDPKGVLCFGLPRRRAKGKGEGTKGRTGRAEGGQGAIVSCLRCMS
jgi:hypothetical protein